MPLFNWALALKSREKVYAMYKNLMILAVEFFENGNNHMYWKHSNHVPKLLYKT